MLKYYKYLCKDGGIWGVEHDEFIVVKCREEAINSGRSPETYIEVVEIEKDEFLILSREIQNNNVKFGKLMGF